VNDLPAIYPFCVSGLPWGDTGSGSVVFESIESIRIILDNIDLGLQRSIPTKEMYVLTAPRLLCTYKLVANGDQATAWDIRYENAQFTHTFVRHDARPGIADGKSTTTLTADLEGRDMVAAYKLLLSALPALAKRSSAEAQRIMLELKPTLALLHLNTLL